MVNKLPITKTEIYIWTCARSWIWMLKYCPLKCTRSRGVCAVPSDFHHYSHVIMSAMASQITGPSTVYPTVYSGADKRKQQSSASLSLVRGIHRWPMNSPHKLLVTGIMFPFNDVIMHTSWSKQRASRFLDCRPYKCHISVEGSVVISNGRIQIHSSPCLLSPHAFCQHIPGVGEADRIRGCAKCTLLNIAEMFHHWGIGQHDHVEVPSYHIADAAMIMMIILMVMIMITITMIRSSTRHNSV